MIVQSSEGWRLCFKGSVAPPRGQQIQEVVTGSSVIWRCPQVQAGWVRFFSDLPLYSLHAMQWDSVSVHSIWSSDKRLWAALQTGWFSQVSLESRAAGETFRSELWGWLSMWAPLWCGSWLDLLHFFYHDGYRREVLTVCLLKSDEFWGFYVQFFWLLLTHHVC